MQRHKVWLRLQVTEPVFKYMQRHKVLLRLQVTEPGKLGCSSIEEVNAVTLGQTMLSKLPSNAIVVQLTENFAVQGGAALSVVFKSS